MRSPFVLTILCVVLAVLPASCGVALAQEAILACAGPVEVRNAPIVRVENDAVLVLRDGRAAVAEGIRLPRAGADEAPPEYEARALAALRGLTVGHQVTLTLYPPKEDRYGRLRAQIFAGRPDGGGKIWVQLALLKQGLARVDFTPQRAECAKKLLSAEADARDSGRGLWASSAYRVRQPGELRGDIGTFQLLEGKVLRADKKGGRAYLDFGPNWHSDFTVTIAPDDMANFHDAGVDPRDYEGERVRVRGFVDRHNGPEIEIANPESIQVLKPPQ